MRRTLCFRTVSCLLLVVFSGLAVDCVFAEMPDGWESLSAPDFVAEVGKTNSRNDTEVIAHAWRVFLGDKEFVLSADLETLALMLDLFGANRSGVSGEDVAALKALVDQKLSPDFIDLQGVNLYSVGNLSKAVGKIGRSRVENSALFVTWMESNQWESLSTADLYNLYSFMNADLVDRRKFSARWTGVITPSQSGEYVFRQLRVYMGDDSRLRVWLSGKLVLDTTGEELAVDSYASSPLSLQAGQSYGFRAELVHGTELINFSASAPMAAVVWEKDGGGAEFIPSQVLSPPSSVELSHSQGLQAEYFSDQEFKVPVLVGVDSSLDLVWSWPPAAPVKREATRRVFAELVARVASSEYLQSLSLDSPEELALTMNYNLWRVAYRMSGEDRIRLVSAIRESPAALEALTLEDVGRLYRALYMLPGNPGVDLYLDWAALHGQPRAVPGSLPDWSNSSYRALNTDYYWSVGHYLQGPYWEQALELQEKGLSLDDGSCNLRVSYVLIYAARDQQRREGGEGSLAKLERLFEEMSRNEDLGGDARATWLIARAFSEEVGHSYHVPRLGKGRRFLEDAYMLAESADVKYSVLQEQAARLASLGQPALLESLLDGLGKQHSSSEQQEDKLKWVERANELSQRYEVSRAKAVERGRAAVSKELERRIDVASKRGGNTQSARLQETLGRRNAEQQE